MYDGGEVFGYYHTNSSIHKLNYTYKIFSILLVFVAIIIANSIIDMLVINLFIFLVLIWSDISIRFYFRNLSIFRYVIVISFFLFSLIYFDFFVGFIWMIKIFDIIMYMSIINMTTSIGNVIYGVYGLLYPFRRFINVSKISLDIGISIKFVNLLYVEYNRVMISKKLRGVKYSDMSISSRFKDFVSGIIPIYKGAIRECDRLRVVMMVRNYSVNSVRSNYRLNKWGKTDTILLVINVILILVILIY